MAELRAVLAQALIEEMHKNENIVVIDADLAKANGTMNIRKEFPERAFDVGIAEQNMASMAAGMSSYGFIPFIGSFTPFATRRICDQIAISIAYAKQNVKIIGSDPGITAELNGGTHMSVEDIGVLRSIPNIVIFEPVDCVQMKKALPQIIEHYGPVYIRMFRKVIPDVFDEQTYEFDLFKADTIKEGSDVSIFASGIMVKEALKANEMLKEKGINAEIINIHTIKPIDADAVLKSVAKTGCAVVCENHNLLGGLASAVCEVTAQNNPVPVEMIGIKDHFGEVAKTPYLLNKYEMTAEHIVTACEKAIKRK
ncbi:MAG: transketolase family protein [Oscillospiraceae bacterium]|nr:transketolase family protein [Oscillospiraceae bacterium]